MKIASQLLIFILLSGTLSAERQPNFIIIFTDDQGYQDLGCFGHPTIKTPNIDKMAAEGVKLTSFYARHKCTPARACLLTGAINFRVGINDIVHPHEKTGMTPEAVTVAELLGDAGYSTACIGKWHLGHAFGFLPSDQGFGYYYGVPGTNHGDSSNHGLPVKAGITFSDDLTMEDYKADAGGKRGTRTILMRNNEVIEWPTDVSTLTQRYTEEAITFIKSNKDRPFFLYLAHSLPHLPYTVSEVFRGKSAHGMYGDIIEEIDWSTGQVLQAVKELGIDKDTLVIFTSDNGGDEKEDKVYKDHKGSCLPLRGWKGSNYEGGSRVPFVARWPGKIPAGSSTEEMASVIDMLPTLTALAEIPVNTTQKIDGKNIWPLMSDPNTPTPHEYLFYAGNSGITGARNRSYKFLESKRGKGELYDLKNDISESTNIVDEHPELAQQFKNAIAAIRADIEAHSLDTIEDHSEKKKKKTKK